MDVLIITTALLVVAASIAQVFSRTGFLREVDSRGFSIRLVIGRTVRVDWPDIQPPVRRMTTPYAQIGVMLRGRRRGFGIVLRPNEMNDDFLKMLNEKVGVADIKTMNDLIRGGRR